MSRNFLHFIVFLIVLSSIFYLFVGCYNKNTYCFFNESYMGNNYIQSNDNSILIDTFPAPAIGDEALTIALVSDSHSNRPIFPLLRESLLNLSPNFVIHAGDLTDYGTLNDLNNAKSDLENLGFNFFVLPGDHDIAQTSSELNFNKVFSTPTFFTHNSINFLLIRNEFNFTPLDENYLNTLIKYIPYSDVVILSQPIYVPEDNIFASKFMGSYDAFDNLSPEQITNLNTITYQRNKLLSAIRDSKNNKIIISGDHHRSSSYPDLVNKNVSYHNIGSLSKFIYFGGTKLSQNSLQSNRYSVLRIFKNNLNNNLEFKIKEIELK